MNQKKIANGLKVFCILVAVVGAIFFFLYIPFRIGELAELFPKAAYLKWPGIIGVWIIAILCYIALWNFWTICTRIGEDNSFCNENADAMKRMAVMAFAIVGLVTLAMVFIGILGFLGMAFFMVYFFVACVAAGVGVVCYALSLLIRKAAEIKEENDLTI